MRILKTKQDFDVLRHSGNLRATLLDQIEAYFLQLKDGLEDEVENELVLLARLHRRSRSR